MAPPGRTVAIGELSRRPVGIGVVPRGEHGARDTVEQRAREGRARRGAGRDVPRAHEHGADEHAHVRRSLGAARVRDRHVDRVPAGGLVGVAEAER